MSTLTEVWFKELVMIFFSLYVTLWIFRTLFLGRGRGITGRHKAPIDPDQDASLYALTDNGQVIDAN